MADKAFVHIGLAKTGSTAIQIALKNQAAALEEAGLRLIETGRFGAAAGHHCLAWNLRDDPKSRINCPTYSFEQTADEIEGLSGTDIILSSEEFSLLAFRPKALQRFRSLFARRELVGIVYVREQVDLFNSFYVEILKDFSTAESVGECVERLSRETRYHYTNWLSAWDDVFDRVDLRPYDREALEGGDVIRDFFDRIGKPNIPNAGAKAKLANESLRPEEVAAFQRIVRQLRREGLTRERIGNARFAQMRARLHGVVRQLPAARSEKYWGIPPRVASSLRESYAGSNAELFERYLGHDFKFSATSGTKRLNTMKFADLPAESQKAVEDALDREINAAHETPTGRVDPVRKAD